jgi:hypothetical protein
MNAFLIKITDWPDDNFTLVTNLSEAKIKAVIEPMVAEHWVGDVSYKDEDFINALMEAYPRATIITYLSEYTTIEF